MHMELKFVARALRAAAYRNYETALLLGHPRGMAPVRCVGGFGGVCGGVGVWWCGAWVHGGGVGGVQIGHVSVQS